jgi:hypothetical protein
MVSKARSATLAIAAPAFPPSNFRFPQDCILPYAVGNTAESAAGGGQLGGREPGYGVGEVEIILGIQLKFVVF